MLYRFFENRLSLRQKNAFHLTNECPTIAAESGDYRGKKHIKVAAEGKEDTVEWDLIVKKAVATGGTQWIFTARTQ